jgi:hypothetical protein
MLPIFAVPRCGSLDEHAVRAAGGRLKFNKNSRTGTLVEALALLRPYARPGVIPNELPSTLARIKALDTKLAAATWKKIPSEYGHKTSNGSLE